MHVLHMKFIHGQSHTNRVHYLLRRNNTNHTKHKSSTKLYELQKKYTVLAYVFSLSFFVYHCACDTGTGIGIGMTSKQYPIF